MSAMRLSFILVVILLAHLPDFSIQQYYRDERYYPPPRWNDPKYYDNYYRYTHNLPISGYYGFGYGNYGYGRDDYGRDRGYNNGRSVNGDAGGASYHPDYYYNRGVSGAEYYNNLPYGGYYRGYYDDDYYMRGRSYASPSGYYHDPQGYYYGQAPYDDYYRRYPLTPGYGAYDYYYGQNMQDYHPPAKNVDPFPGQFAGFGSVYFVRGGPHVELQCNLSKDGNKLVSSVVWVKVENAYRPFPYGPPPYTANPYYCSSGGCLDKAIDLTEKRFIADMHGDIATLHIYDLQPRDYGVYRCSGTVQANSGSSGDTNTIYQIVEFFN
ncbi:uncharacterized protein LOC111263082 [Varroa jacobsoni]|uniref:uncharacterized protein LOC111263082 n=1 Tax=Varroa jacobsoni TaxID=62625 RepID=UPI000BF942FB|nr:uncharacterized protein LOC111263082 [Varroa jacobsoni]